MHDLKQYALTKLLAAATFIDLMLTLAGALILKELVGPYILIDQQYTLLVLLPLTLILHIVIVEIILGGRSFGRMCVGLQFCQIIGDAPLSHVQKLQRAFSTLISLGFGDLRTKRLAKHHNLRGVCLKSTMVGRYTGSASQPQPTSQPKLDTTPRPQPQQRQNSHPQNPALSSAATRAQGFNIYVVEGPDKGTKESLTSGKLFSAHGEFRIGKNPGWADMLLPNDKGVSGEHCIVLQLGTQLYLVDYGRGGLGSTNGTVLNGKRLPPKQRVPLGLNMPFQVANSVLVIRP
jgi:pSer/pThr/pTyr-binding forkhead associated (FHA) protein